MPLDLVPPPPAALATRDITLTPFQDRFLFSTARFPALIAAIGTGKTFMGLLKVWNFCRAYPGATALIIRKEFTDLRDSTLKDFTRYFGVGVDGNKEYKHPNGSVMMFRHGGELNVLKNMTVDIVLIEQAEEFDTDEEFEFLRDRLRGKAGPSQHLCLIANANGHNWIWRRWINNPDVDGSVASIAACRPMKAGDTVQCDQAGNKVRVFPQTYEVTLATTFDNAVNLPPAYIEDQRQRAAESPEHFAQYVMNRFDVTDVTDAVITAALWQGGLAAILPSVGLRRRILGVDVARYGKDEIVFSLIESRGFVSWEQVYQETAQGKSIPWTAGRVGELIREFEIHGVVVDDDGIGGGVTDILGVRSDVSIQAFHGGIPSANPKYVNVRTEAAFRVVDMLQKKWLKPLKDDALYEQALSLRYRYHRGDKDCILLVPKEEQRAKGLPSPDRFDALMMALFFSDTMFRQDRTGRLPAYAKTSDEDEGSVRDVRPTYALP